MRTGAVDQHNASYVLISTECSGVVPDQRQQGGVAGQDRAGGCDIDQTVAAAMVNGIIGQKVAVETAPMAPQCGG